MQVIRENFGVIWHQQGYFFRELVRSLSAQGISWARKVLAFYVKRLHLLRINYISDVKETKANALSLASLLVLLIMLVRTIHTHVKHAGSNLKEKK